MGRESIYKMPFFMNTAQNDLHCLDCPVENSLKPVNFYCAAPDAESVQIAMDFNDWYPLDMKRLLDGWWYIRLGLCHGNHQYRFIVDSKPQLDPHAMGSTLDERNELVSLIAVS